MKRRPITRADLRNLFGAHAPEFIASAPPVGPCGPLHPRGEAAAPGGDSLELAAASVSSVLAAVRGQIRIERIRSMRRDRPPTPGRLAALERLRCWLAASASLTGTTAQDLDDLAQRGRAALTLFLRGEPTDWVLRPILDYYSDASRGDMDPLRRRILARR